MASCPLGGESLPQMSPSGEMRFQGFFSEALVCPSATKVPNAQPVGERVSRTATSNCNSRSSPGLRGHCSLICWKEHDDCPADGVQLQKDVLLMLACHFGMFVRMGIWSGVAVVNSS